jgi:hypothetical protein
MTRSTSCPRPAPSTRPDATVTEFSLFVGGEVLILRVAESPDFVALNSLAGEVSQGLILKFGAGLTGIDAQRHN